MGGEAVQDIPEAVYHTARGRGGMVNGGGDILYRRVPPICSPATAIYHRLYRLRNGYEVYTIYAYTLYLLMCKIYCETLYGLLPGKYIVNLGAHGKYEYWPAVQQIFTANIPLKPGYKMR